LFGPGGTKSECTDQLSYTSGLFSSEDKVCTKEEKGLYIFSFTSLKQNTCATSEVKRFILAHGFGNTC
jgi:hypothetical protein